MSLVNYLISIKNVSYKPLKNLIELSSYHCDAVQKYLLIKVSNEIATSPSLNEKLGPLAAKFYKIVQKYYSVSEDDLCSNNLYCKYKLGMSSEESDDNQSFSENQSNALAGFLFGNIDERGRIESDFLEDDIKINLVKYASQITAEDDNEFILSHKMFCISSDKKVKDETIRPLETAVDFSDFTEDGDINQGGVLLESSGIFSSPSEIKYENHGIVSNLDENYDEEEEEEENVHEQPNEPDDEVAISKARNIKDIFPYFTPDSILKFTELFSTSTKNGANAILYPLNIRPGDKESAPIKVEPDQALLFSTRPQVISRNVNGVANFNYSIVHRNRLRKLRRLEAIRDAFNSRKKEKIDSVYLELPALIRDPREDELFAYKIIPWEENIIFESQVKSNSPNTSDTGSNFLQPRPLFAEIPSSVTTSTIGAPLGGHASSSSFLQSSGSSYFVYQQDLQAPRPRLTPIYQSSQNIKPHQFTPPPSRITPLRSTPLLKAPIVSIPVEQRPFYHASRFSNNALNSKDDWLNEIILDECEMPSKLFPTGLILDTNDPNLIFEPIDARELQMKRGHHQFGYAKNLPNHANDDTLMTSYTKPWTDRFNLSNDHLYEADRKAAKAAREKLLLSRSGRGIGGVIGSSSSTIQHSIPALLLSPPFFKTHYSKDELRAFHRPALRPSIGVALKFTDLRNDKSKQSQQHQSTNIQREFGEVPRNHNSLSLRFQDDDSEFILLEYSEELPLLMMNGGMCTSILNFIRKGGRFPVEEHELKFLDGLNVTLEIDEPGPLFGFGDVEPGKFLSVISNNLFRAPIWRQPIKYPLPPSSNVIKSISQIPAICSNNNSENLYCDFLGIRWRKRENVRADSKKEKWYMRSIPGDRVYVVGQQLPLAEVFGPNSRKNNLYTKARVTVAAYRLFEKHEKVTGNKILKISKLTEAFSGVSEASIRKWIKEFADPVRKGGTRSGAGLWEFRSSSPGVNLTEEEIRSLVTPEMACLWESMSAGHQRLIDAGVVSNSYNADDNEMDESAENEAEAALDEGLKLAPWILTRNFVQATAGKAVLQIIGPGDPTGKGEGFSFIKVPHKAAFFRSTTSIAVSDYQTTSAIPSVSQLSTSTSSTSGSSNSAITGKTTMAEQNKLYREDIQRVWKAQVASLSSQQYPLDDYSFAQTETIPSKKSSLSAFTTFNKSPAPSAAGDDEITSVGSRTTIQKKSSKKLTITRQVIDPETKETITRTEFIEDLRVIRAYLKAKEAQRKQLETFQNSNNPTYKAGMEGSFQSSGPTSETIQSTKAKSRKKTSSTLLPVAEIPEGAITLADGTILAADGVTKLKVSKRPQMKCGSCGALGHMKTNRACPNWTPDVAAAAFGSPSSFTVTAATNTPSPLLKVDGTKLKISKSGLSKASLSTKSGRKSSSKLLNMDEEDFLSLNRRKRPLKELSELIEDFLTDLIKIPNASPFALPVKERDAPRYSEIVKNPIDLSTMRAKAKRMNYKSVAEFISDMQLMVNNCVMYNGPQHGFSVIAQSLLQKTVEWNERNSEKLFDLEEKIKSEQEKREAHHPPPPPPVSQSNSDNNSGSTDNQSVLTNPPHKIPKLNIKLSLKQQPQQPNISSNIVEGSNDDEIIDIISIDENEMQF